MLLASTAYAAYLYKPPLGAEQASLIVRLTRQVTGRCTSELSILAAVGVLLRRNESEVAHEAIASALWEANSDAEAMATLAKLAQSHGAEWEAQARASDRGCREDSDDRG